MADTYVQTVDLSPLIREVKMLSSGLDTISRRVEAAGNKIDLVETEVTDVRRTVNTLVEKFAHMLNKQEKSYAATEVVRVRQELEKKFGHYETVRKNMLGILQANDLALVKEDTISQCSEELMLAAPGYWLAPALVALAAWISDNPTLANRAVREAVKRDEEKTYLLFALICRRAGRLEARGRASERFRRRASDPRRTQYCAVARNGRRGGGFPRPEREKARTACRHHRTPCAGRRAEPLRSRFGDR